MTDEVQRQQPCLTAPDLTQLFQSWVTVIFVLKSLDIHLHLAYNEAMTAMMNNQPPVEHKTFEHTLTGRVVSSVSHDGGVSFRAVTPLPHPSLEGLALEPRELVHWADLGFKVVR